MPKVATLRAIVPPCITKRETIASWRGRVAAALAEREKTILSVRAQHARPVLGRKAVLKTKPTQAPPPKAMNTNLRPGIACKDPERRRLELEALQTFRVRYAEVRKRWVAGDRRVAFPAGTYRMRLLGQRCAPFL